MRAAARFKHILMFLLRRCYAFAIRCAAYFATLLLAMIRVAMLLPGFRCRDAGAYGAAYARQFMLARALRAMMRYVITAMRAIS